MLRSCIMCGAAFAALGAAAALAQPPDQGPERLRVELRAQPRITFLSGPSETGEYWLGVMCFPTEPALRSQLNLPEKQGMLVVEVVSKSPAAKAGIARHDVLLRFGERTLGEPRDLVEAVEAAKETVQKIELVRGGKHLTIEATPAKRPEEARQMPEKFVPPPARADWETVQKWLEQMRPGREDDTGRPPLRFRFFHPGAIVPKDVLVQKPMPANMSVVVSKVGEQPAQIVVRRGDDKWELTEKELDKLPAEVRPFVERMLGRGAIGFGGLKVFDVVPDVMAPAMRGAPGGKFQMPQPGQMQFAPLPGLDPRLERRFDEMNRRLDRILKLMEETWEEDDDGQPPESDD